MREPRSPLQQAQQFLVHALGHEKVLTTGHKYLNDTEKLRTWLEVIRSNVLPSTDPRLRNKVLPQEIADLITADMARDAIRAMVSNEPWPEQDDIPEPRPISDFDQQEIFRDPQRGIPGIGASSRLRLRKFFDTASGDFFTAPETRVYGRSVERFRTAVREWAWRTQKELFIDDFDGTGEMELPRQDYLERYGGSYEDTSDGTLLNEFFSMSGQKVGNYVGNVKHLHDEEGGNEFEEMEEELEEVLNTAQNRAEHVSFHAEVEGDEEPYTHGGAHVTFQFDIEWEGGMDTDGDTYVWPEEERDYATIPKSWGGAYDSRRFFANMLDEAFPSYSEDTNWEVSSDYLEVTFSLNFDGSTPDEFDSFCDEMISEIDGDYDEIFQKIRRKLVQEDYLPPNDFDRLGDDIVEQSNELKNWEVLGIDDDDNIDDDGQVWFNFKPLGVGASASTMVYLPGKFPGLIGDTIEALRSVFGNPGEIDKRMVNPGVLFTNMSIEKSKPLVDAANGYVEQQLEFDFGDQYNRPSYEPIDFGHAMIRLNIDGSQGVYFTMKLIVEASSDEADIKGAFEFMRFIDRYPNQIIKVVTDTYEAFLQNKLDEIKDRERKMLDGTDMNTLSRALELQMGGAANNGEQGAEQGMLVIMFIQQNWDKFNRFEKDAAVNNYLRPMFMGSARPYGMWTNDEEKPSHWDGIVRAKMGVAKVPNAGFYKWGGGWKPEPSVLAKMQHRLGMNPEDSVTAEKKLDGLSPDERSKAMAALVAGDREEFVRIIRGTDADSDPAMAGGPIVRNARGERMAESLEQQIGRIDNILSEREPIDLRLYKVALGCVVDLGISGLDNQIENQIRGIKEVTTVSHRVELERQVGASVAYRVYDVKFELYGQQARDTYRDSTLVPAMNREVEGLKVVERGPVQSVDNPLREWGGLGYAAPPYDHYLPTMPTPRIALQSVLEDWVEGGVQIYDTPMNTNQMRYHVMMPVSDLWEYVSRYYRGTKTDFDGRYKKYIKDGAQMPVYIALGQNGRVKITGNEDLIWFAKKSGEDELPVFFSYQRQV